ncbi:MAG: hypothetical protein V4717_02105 [Bacteroidota bacterium]
MRLPRWLFILVSVVGILYWSQSLWKGNSEPSVFDLPKTLEKETYSITVYPVSNVNGVPVFTTGKGGLEEDYLYLTPATGSVDFPADYSNKKDSGYVLKVSGKFFKGKGIPEEYLYTSPKPERLRVFQFTKAELVPSQNNL